MMRAALLVPFALLAAATGCGGDREDRATAAAGPAASAAADAAMCAEHGVLEAVCTTCNPKLRPIFQSRGDWCAEHEWPESFCPVCHPERGGRPAQDVTGDEAPADRLRVKFADADVARKIGLETAEALAESAASVVLAPAVLVPDASRSAAVNVRVPGVIKAFRADLGSRVSAGSPLAEIESSGAAEDRARLSAARAQLEAAEAEHRREADLHAKGITAAKDLQAAAQAAEEARAAVEAASAAVGMAGASAGRSDTYTLVAPIDGIVTARRFTVGTLVDREEVVFEILDPSILWAEIDIPETQAARVAAGQRVLLEIDGIPGRTFEGTVRYVAPVVDPSTRTVRARASLGNADGALRANGYGRARILVPSPDAAALVPRSAVQEAKGVTLVFVPVAPDEFETRRVRVVPSDGDVVAVTSGIAPGERVVTTGSFLLKTETLKGSIGAGCCEVEPAT